MLHAVGPAAGRVAAVVPVTLLTVFAGLLWLLGLVAGEKGREYVTEISNQAMRAASAMMGAALAELPESLPAQSPSEDRSLPLELPNWPSMPPTWPDGNERP
jgi:hypothetical protein